MERYFGKYKWGWWLIGLIISVLFFSISFSHETIIARIIFSLIWALFSIMFGYLGEKGVSIIMIILDLLINFGFVVSPISYTWGPVLLYIFGIVFVPIGIGFSIYLSRIR